MTTAQSKTSKDILTLTKGWVPHQWISTQKAIEHEAKGQVLQHIGEAIILYRGGTNALTGKQSELVTSSIIVIDDGTKPSVFKEPTLTNPALFKRDCYLCAYCGHTFKAHELTRDHYHPTSKGGRDHWTNVVAACKECNSLKGDLMPGQKLHAVGPQGNYKMDPLFLPYVPCQAEAMILRNRSIKADQMAFLLTRVKNKQSRMFKYAESLFGPELTA